jgi:hypothetical protein
VFISETKQQKERVSNISFRISMSHSFVVYGVGKGGGLALFWDDSIKAHIILYGLHHIDTTIWSHESNMSWRQTFVYGEPKTQDRHLMWELMKRIKNRLHAPWLMIGDFNEVMWPFEHFSSRARRERQMANFREVLSHCELHDLGFSSVP